MCYFLMAVFKETEPSSLNRLNSRKQDTDTPSQELTRQPDSPAQGLPHQLHPSEALFDRAEALAQKLSPWPCLQLIQEEVRAGHINHL